MLLCESAVSSLVLCQIPDLQFKGAALLKALTHTLSAADVTLEHDGILNLGPQTLPPVKHQPVPKCLPALSRCTLSKKKKKKLHYWLKIMKKLVPVVSSGPFGWRADPGCQQRLQLWPPRRLWLRLADRHPAQTQTGKECENPCVWLYDSWQTEGVGEDRCTHHTCQRSLWIMEYDLLSLINKELLNLFHWRFWSHVANLLRHMVPNKPLLWFMCFCFYTCAFIQCAIT